MKTLTRIATIISLFCLTAQAAPSAQSKSTGIGIILGDPTGLSVQANGNTSNPINFGLAYKFSDWLQIWGDYTFKFPQFFDSVFHTHTGIAGYIGIGPALLFVDDDVKFKNNIRRSSSLGLLARVPFGLEYKLSSAPIGFMLELVPAILLIPATDFTFQGGIGARFYF